MSVDSGGTDAFVFRARNVRTGEVLPRNRELLTRPRPILVTAGAVEFRGV